MIYYLVLNKAQNQKHVITEKAYKNLPKSDKYELIGECDANGRTFDYNNFLTQTTNVTKSIGQPEQGVETKKESVGNPIGNKKPVLKPAPKPRKKDTRTVDIDEDDD